MHQSIIQVRGSVRFADFTAERIYMLPFAKKLGLPKQHGRWQPTVDAMLEGIETDREIFMMVDQAHVRAGMPHRRPGVHMDGYWHPGPGKHGSHSASCHGGSGGGHGGGGWAPPRHWGNPSGSHGSRGGSHRDIAPDRGHSHGPRHTGWRDCDFTQPEAIILSSNVQACRGFIGDFTGNPGDGGDCSHIEIAGMEVVPMLAGTVYAGNVSMLHESLPVPFDCLRTVVRLNVPGWTP